MKTFKVVLKDAEHFNLILRNAEKYNLVIHDSELISSVLAEGNTEVVLWVVPSTMYTDISPVLSTVELSFLLDRCDINQEITITPNDFDAFFSTSGSELLHIFPSSVSSDIELCTDPSDMTLVKTALVSDWSQFEMGTMRDMFINDMCFVEVV